MSNHCAAYFLFTNSPYPRMKLCGCVCVCVAKSCWLSSSFLAPSRRPRPAMNSALSRCSDKQREVFHAPFCTTWFCTAWTGLFCPLCLACHSCFQRDKDSLKVSLKTIAQNFRDRGVTFKVRSCSSICSSSSSSMAEQRPGVGGRRQCARQVCHHGEPK
ncbi:uncharacterized protein LOC135098780 isoform X4 [Scylla paramamosain]|uniref:uncharacterized protein LOC135098780 isoform X4 n=1 Tax=Scylla paramamosain TaxID=85552 RepID=UPI00308377BE